MTLRLFQFDAHPNEVAVTKVDSFVTDGVFFLDFSRPLEVQRRRFGLADALFIPVVHLGEHKGGFVIGVHRSDPSFPQLRALWKERHPSQRSPPTTVADGLKIIADFATQFPDDSQ